MSESILLSKNLKKDPQLLEQVSYMGLVNLKHKYRFPASMTSDYEYIIQVVCDWYGITRREIELKTRRREIVMPRQIAMYLLYKYTRLSLQKIGTLFLGKDHTTALHSIGTVEDLMDTDARYRETVQALEIKIQ